MACWVCGAWLAAACFVAGCKTSAAETFTAADADILFQAHVRAFYRVEDGRAWFTETTLGGKATFWTQAEQMEMVLDAAGRTAANTGTLGMFTNLFRGFVAKHGTDWTRNNYNDDIMWMVIACTRGYLLTGNREFRDVARANFDACFARAWSSDLGGGLWWKTDRQSKNACVNGPAAIAAALLARACQEPAYLAKAKNIFLWERATLFDSATGRVYDNIHLSGRKASKSYSYNQGTFVGAANLLGCTNDAMLAATYTMNQLCHDGFFPAGNETGDSAGFNGICARWIAQFMNERGAQAIFEPWLQKNADAAWNARRLADGLSWCRWPQPTPPGTRYSWGCSSAVVLLQVMRPAEILKGENSRPTKNPKR